MSIIFFYGLAEFEMPFSIQEDVIGFMNLRGDARRQVLGEYTNL
jgi:hypothetical protein